MQHAKLLSVIFLSYYVNAFYIFNKETTAQKNPRLLRSSRAKTEEFNFNKKYTKKLNDLKKGIPNLGHGALGNNFNPIKTQRGRTSSTDILSAIMSPPDVIEYSKKYDIMPGPGDIAFVETCLRDRANKQTKFDVMSASTLFRQTLAGDWYKVIGYLCSGPESMSKVNTVMCWRQLLQHLYRHLNSNGGIYIARCVADLVNKGSIKGSDTEHTIVGMSSRSAATSVQTVNLQIDETENEKRLLSIPPREVFELPKSAFRMLNLNTQLNELDIDDDENEMETTAIPDFLITQMENDK